MTVEQFIELWLAAGVLWLVFDHGLDWLITWNSRRALRRLHNGNCN